MKLYKIFFLILFLVFLINIPVVLAVKQIPQNSSNLQPIPVGIAPDISHNINSAQSKNQPSSPLYQNTPNSQNSSNNLLPNTSVKNNPVMMYVLTAVMLLIIFLIFLYFKK